MPGLKIAKWMYAESKEETRSDRKYSLLTKYLGATW